MVRSRRDVLRTGGAVLAASIAGCSATNEQDDPEPTTTATTTFEPADSLPTPTLGSEDAPVSVSVYADYACKHCLNYVLDTFPQLREEYIETDVISYEHHDFPLPVDERWSWEIPSAALSVLDTRDLDSFFAFSTAIYEHHGSYSYDVIETVAESVGADPDRVRRAAEEQQYRQIVEADRETGASTGVDSTPTIFVDGSMPSHYRFDAVAEAIEIARA
ncbi:Protein-disulfide isomerase [Halanaeroarchaeum sp. HSR-CO]|uniref:DsbA family protein n=1 Tax=Halanaeroarchaeum sp. HSR-CO TaxID=2866382 RepID=UPI00217D1B2D|nr:DsbA family protein [Halanaeroarchaeum sp. HSR-CO]UWG47771.1 Protein-disulfide isomerase [Halanaeroarchaeum sp. HSR-CO]